jgi:hypothetical protein
MSAASIAKIKKARQTDVPIDGKTFTIRRPTPLEAMEWLGDIDADKAKSFFEQRFSLKNAEWRALAWESLRCFVDDWPGMQEIDIIPGGVGAPLAFDREVFLEWVKDHPDIITQLGYHILMAWMNHLQAQDDMEKKSQTGSPVEASQNSPTEN